MNAAISVPFVEVTDLRVAFPVTRGVLFRRTVAEVVAVDGVSFRVERGQTLGIVGESGCGKSTLLRTLLHLYRPSSGEVRLDGTSLTTASNIFLRDFRRRVQVVFQDPFMSLDPRMKIRDIIREPVDHGRIFPGDQLTMQRVDEVLALVGLDSTAGDRYPHQFSGGQKQRIAIARAIAPKPDLILLDEPTSALDVSVRAQVMNLLVDLRSALGLTYVMVSHDLGAISYLCDRVIVMYLGRIVEIAPSTEIYSSPRHPYSQLLLSSARQIDINKAGFEDDDVDPPSAMDTPSGCRFHPRCQLRKQLGQPEICEKVEPAMIDLGAGRSVACHFCPSSYPPSPTFDGRTAMGKTE